MYVFLESVPTTSKSMTSRDLTYLRVACTLSLVESAPLSMCALGFVHISKRITEPASQT